MSTADWNGAAVVNILLYLVGIVELRSISLVAMPPTVSIESESGVTSRSTIAAALEPAESVPPSFPPWMAAPIATHSSGLMLRLGSWRSMVLTLSMMTGMRVEPPTSRTLLISAEVRPASMRAVLTGISVLCTRSRVRLLKYSRVIVISMWSGPSRPTVMNGRFTV